MKAIAIVNGYEIKFDNREDNTNTHPYIIKYGKKLSDKYVFRSLKTATNWAKNH